LRLKFTCSNISWKLVEQQWQLVWQVEDHPLAQLELGAGSSLPQRPNL
jgi:hypothetical protein